VCVCVYEIQDEMVSRRCDAVESNSMLTTSWVKASHLWSLTFSKPYPAVGTTFHPLLHKAAADGVDMATSQCGASGQRSAVPATSWHFAASPPVVLFCHSLPLLPITSIRICDALKKFLDTVPSVCLHSRLL
jgi:hypothetical protein